MNAYTNRSLSVGVLLYVSLALSSGARGLRAIARTLGRWLERRRAARVALQELSAMSDRELRDIGIARSDIERVAAQSSLGGVPSGPLIRNRTLGERRFM